MKNTDFTKGYDKGFSDAQEKLGLEFNRVLALKEDLAYEKGFNRGWQKNEYQSKWIKIEDEVPEKEVSLLYYFEDVGIWQGYYYGIEKEYCPETGHVFGSNGGFLTGDVTHWMYLPEPPE